MSEDPGPMRGSATSDNKPTQRFRSYGKPPQQQFTVPEPGRHAARRRTQVTPAHPPAEPAPPYQTPPHGVLPPQQPPQQQPPQQQALQRETLQQRAASLAAEPAPDDIVRYGPGVPGSQASLSAEPASPAGRLRRLSRGRVRLLGLALTVILLGASGVIFYQRYQHAPFEVANVEIAQQAPTRCGVDVTALITTNGAAGAITYQWVSRPPRGTPQPLSQTVIAGQDAVYVTVAVQGVGHGSGSEVLTLRVLRPDLRSASTGVVIRC